MSFRALKSDDNADDADDIDDNAAHRRLSLQVTDLPVTTYWNRWNCCKNCCKREKSYDALLDDEDEEISSLKSGKSPSSTSESKKNERAQNALIAEQCLDATVNKIVNNLSWVNATLLAVAMKNTLQIDFKNVSTEYSAANNAWIYFFIIFIVGILLAVLPRTFEDLTEMKRELNLIKVEQKIAKGDEEEIAKQQQQIDDKKEESEEWIIKETAKIYNFVEVEINDLVEKFEDLFVDTLSNTVSMAWRDAAKATFALMISSASATATAYFFYALFMTTFGIYLVIRIGGVYEQKEKEIINYLDENNSNFNTPNVEKKQLLKFAFIKRSIKLTQTVVKFAIAWSWRDCINAFIHAIYGSNNNDPIAQQWGFFFTIALFVSVAFSFSEQFHILYPKNATPQEQQLFLKDKSRLIVNDVLYDNFRFVVGMALFDALRISLESLSHRESGVSPGGQCALYWFVAIGGVSLSVVGTHYVEKWGLRKKIANQGMAQALFDTFERFYDPKCELHIEGDSDFVPMILDTTVFELVYVTVFGLGIAGSMGTTNAIKFTINLITAGSGYYDLSNPDEMASGVWIIWVSFLICLAISTLIVGYFARMIEAAKKSRRSLFDKMKIDDEDIKEKMIKKGNNDKDRFSALPLDDDDYDDDKEEEEEERNEEKDNDIKKRKHKEFSTKAEDEGNAINVALIDDAGNDNVVDDDGGGDDVGNDDGGDIGGGDDGGGDGGDAGK